MIPQRWQPLVQLVAARIREYYRQPTVIFWAYGFPLILALTLGFAFRGNEPPPPHVDVQDAPDRARADKVADTLKADGIKVEVLSGAECEKRIVQGKTSLYVIAHPSEIEYVYDPAGSEGTLARYRVEAVLLRSESITKSKETLPSEPGGRYVHRLLPALICTNVMGGGLFGVGFSLVDMRVRKLFKRLMATPMRHSDFLLSLLMSRFCFLIPEMTSLILVSYFAFGLPIRGSIFTVILIIFVGAAAFAGLGILVGSRVEKTETATGLIQLLVMPQYILSGVFFSSQNFPDAMQPVIKALPLTQMIDAMREVMLEGKTLWEVSWHIAILAAYAVAGFTLALYGFKWR